MTDTILVVYEHGVLRPLLPLPLPENTRMQVRIVHPRIRTIHAPVARQRVYEALVDAGLIRPPLDGDLSEPVSEQELVEAAEVLGTAGPISEVIMAERAESY